MQRLIEHVREDRPEAGKLVRDRRERLVASQVFGDEGGCFSQRENLRLIKACKAEFVEAKKIDLDFICWRENCLTLILANVTCACIEDIYNMICNGSCLLKGDLRKQVT